MNQEAQAILIDVDDTLVPTNGDVSPAFYEALSHLSQLIKGANKGLFPPIGFCTGRDRNYVEGISFVVGSPDAWSVIESGIAIFNPRTKQMMVRKLAKRKRIAFDIIRHDVIPDLLRRMPGLFDYPGNMVNIALELQHGVDLNIERCYWAIREEIQEFIQDELVTISHSRIAVDISPAGVNKSSGVRFLSKITGIKPEQMLGMGDSRGDFSMLELVGFVGCPANASPECQELVTRKGGYVSPFKYAEGVIDIICHFIPDVKERSLQKAKNF